MFNKYFTIKLAVGLLTSNLCWAITMDEVLKAVEERHPLVMANLQAINKSKGQVLSAEGNFDLTLKVDGNAMPLGYYDSSRLAVTLEQPTKINGLNIFSTYAVTDGEWPIYDGKLITNDGGEVRLGASLPLAQDGSTDQRRTAITLAERDLEISNLNLELQKLVLKLNAADSYINWLRNLLKVSIYEQLLSTAKERTKQLEERFSKGDIAEFDLLDNQRAELQRQIQLNDSMQELASSAINLSLFYLDSNGSPVYPAGKTGMKDFPQKLFLYPASLDLAISQALTKRPELVIVGKRIKKAKSQLDLADNRLLPKLNLEVFTAQNFGNGPQDNDEFELYSGLRFELPFERRKAKGEYEQAQSEIAELQAIKNSKQQEITAQLEDLWQIIKQAREREKLASEEYLAAIRLEQGEQVKLDLGDSNLIFINIREQTRAEAAIRKLAASADLIKACYKFGLLAGQI